MSVHSLPTRDAVRPLTERVAEEVRALMARYGVTQMQMIQVLGVSQTGVSRRLRGIIPFDANELGVLAEFFNVDAAELLGTSRNPHPGGPDGGSGESVRREGIEPPTRCIGDVEVTACPDDLGSIDFGDRAEAA